MLSGFLSPASRGALLTALLVMYLLSALGAGFASVWMWGLIQRSYEGWSAVTWRCAAYFPGITLLVLSLLNVLLYHTGSSGAIPLTAFFSLISLWFIISIPLCFSGVACCLPDSLTLHGCF
jgi:transmembrane 9 superfamily protein 2/4